MELTMLKNQQMRESRIDRILLSRLIIFLAGILIDMILAVITLDIDHNL